jgi:hypothetical protein
MPLTASNSCRSFLSTSCSTCSSGSLTRSSFLGDGFHHRASVQLQSQLQQGHRDTSTSYSPSNEIAPRCGRARIIRSSFRDQSGERFASVNLSSFRLPAWSAAEKASKKHTFKVRAQAQESVAAKNLTKSGKNADQDNLNGQERLSKVSFSSLLSSLWHFGQGKEDHK